MVKLETDGRMTRQEVASFLREFVDELEAGPDARPAEDRTGRDGTTEARPPAEGATEGREAGRGPTDRGRGGDGAERRDDELTPADQPGDTHRVTFVVGGESATVSIPETVEFDVSVQSRSPLLSSGADQEITFELAWKVEETRTEGDTIEMK